MFHVFFGNGNYDHSEYGIGHSGCGYSGYHDFGSYPRIKILAKDQKNVVGIYLSDFCK